jgi:hypothetical protein
MRISSQVVGIDLRKRIGGSRGHSSGSGMIRVGAGSVGPSLSIGPRLSRSIFGGPASPSTWNQQVFQSL